MIEMELFLWWWRRVVIGAMGKKVHMENGTVTISYAARVSAELSVTAGQTVDVMWPSRALGSYWCITRDDPPRSGLVPFRYLDVMPSLPVGPAVRDALFAAIRPTHKHSIGQRVEFEVELPSATGCVWLDISRVIHEYPVKTKEVYVNEYSTYEEYMTAVISAQANVNLLTIREVTVEPAIQRCGVFYAIVEALLHTPVHKCWLSGAPTAVMVQAVLNEELRTALRRNPAYIDQSINAPASCNVEQLNPSFVKLAVPA